MSAARDELSRPLLFSADMQNRFAELSGDYNPMHIDEVAARRFLYGRTVAHGVHVVLRALERALALSPQANSLSHLRARFSAPVLTGATAEFQTSCKDDGQCRISAVSAGATAMDLSVALANEPSTAAGLTLPGGSPPRETPETMAAAGFEGPVSGSVPLALDESLAGDFLPMLTERLPASQIAVLLAATRIVGMKCPGYHSIFSELELRFDADAPLNDRLDYSVDSWDPRFRLVTLSISGGGARGQIKAFLRPAPQEQPTLAELADGLAADAFAGERAMVVGGSRGLGEFVAKLMAAGGADVCITYHRGADEAAAIAREIEATGRHATALRYDARTPGDDSLDELRSWQPTHLFFFATPTIYHAERTGFSQAHFNALCEIYLGGFSRLIESLTSGDSLRYVFCPSSEYVDSLPKGMPEYVAAKSASEGLCRYLARRHPDVRFVSPRLPRLATDQTADLLSPAVPPSVDTLREALGL
jgi:hypothetical protein